MRAAGLAVSVRVCVCVRACERVSARTKDDYSVSTDRRQVQDRTRILAFASTSTREDSLAAPHTSYVQAHTPRRQTGDTIFLPHMRAQREDREDRDRQTCF